MIQKLKLLLSNKLISGSFIFLSASMVANVGSYLFHFLTGRWLGPANYSIFESLVSILYFLAIPGGVFGLLIIKLSSEKKNNPDQIGILTKTLVSQMALWGFVILVIFLITAVFLQQHLQIPSYWLLVGIGLVYYLGSITSPVLSILQGMTEFITLGWLSIVGSWSKVLFAIPLLLLGFQLGGVIASMVIGSVAVTLIILFITRKKINFTYQPIYRITSKVIKKNGNFLIASFLLSLTVTALYTTDILIARKFLPPVEAGYYSALSVLGKIIFFASSAVNSVMFPFVVEKHSQGGNSKKTLITSLALVLIISSGSLAVYALFPKLMISVLFGASYLPAAPYLLPFAFFICLYALSMTLLNYYMGISKVKVIYFASIFAIFQLGLLLFRHASISEIISVNTLVLSTLLACLLIKLIAFPEKSNSVLLNQ